MKRKLFSLLLILILIVGLTGCGSAKKENTSNNSNEEIEEEVSGVNGQDINTKIKADIVNNDGKKEKKAWYELNDLIEENNEYFEKHYKGASAHIIDTVESIDKDVYEHEIDAYTYELVLSSGWYVYIDQNENDLSDVLKGTKVEINSFIDYNDYWPTLHGKYTLPAGESAGYGKAQETVKSTIKILD